MGTEELKALKRIEEKVDGLHGMTFILQTANRKQILDEIVDYFTKPKPQKRAIQVFFCVDGEKTLSQISKSLKMGFDKVSRECNKLSRKGYIEPVRHGKNKTYSRVGFYERLGIMKDLRKKLKKGLGDEIFVGLRL